MLYKLGRLLQLLPLLLLPIAMVGELRSSIGQGQMLMWAGVGVLVFMTGRKSFGSDNHTGGHPAVLRAVMEANSGDAVAYGADPWTERVTVQLREAFQADGGAFLVLNGTGANVLGLSVLLDVYNILNANTVIQSNHGTGRTTISESTINGGTAVLVQNFLLPTTILPPRIARISAQIRAKS